MGNTSPEFIQFLCDDHEDIKHYARVLTKIIYEKVEDEEVQASMFKVLDDIHSKADHALSCGVKMEDRMRAYREAIEGLGFIRNRED